MADRARNSEHGTGDRRPIDRRPLGFSEGGHYGYEAERESVRGPYTGLGPKGYRRSDERIREDACERLTEHDHVDAREIECTVRDGEVTLAGTVGSRREKRLAEDVIDTVPGVRDVHNQLRIRQDGEPRAPSGGPRRARGGRAA